MDIMFHFIRSIERKKLLTKFIIFIFDYEDFHDYNYLFRMTKNGNLLIIDIYDNISDNRFNRYIFSFDSGEDEVKKIENDNVFVTKIFVKNILDSDDKLFKLAYLFKLDKTDMLDYAKTFLDKEYVEILSKIIK